MNGTIASTNPHTTHFNCCRATVFLLITKRRISNMALAKSEAANWINETQ